jgi:hypothetical protein
VDNIKMDLGRKDGVQGLRIRTSGESKMLGICPVAAQAVASRVHGAIHDECIAT